MQIWSDRSRPLKCYRKSHFYHTTKLCHSDQRFLRYKLQKSGDFPYAVWQNGLEDVLGDLEEKIFKMA